MHDIDLKCTKSGEEDCEKGEEDVQRKLQEIAKKMQRNCRNQD